MKTKRQKNGIKTVMFSVRLDEDIHQWLKDSGTNASAIINKELRQRMEIYNLKQQYLKL